jgi:BASS family bile acid:Na+ symporter
MQAAWSLSIGLPVALVIIMLGLGLSLKADDFRNVIARPMPLIIGLLCHSVVLPLLCVILMLALGLPPAISVGMVLLSVSPAGTTAALFTHLARGDVALSIVMAAVTSLLSVIVLPLASNLSFLLFYGQAEAISLDMTQVAQFFAIATVPALVGMWIRSRHPSLSDRLERPVKLLATVFLAAIVVVALASNWRLALQWGPSAGLVALMFSILTLATAYYLPRLAGIQHRQAVSLALTITIHNAALVITMAMSEFMLNNHDIAIPPALYGVIGYVTSAVFVAILSSRKPAQQI